MSFARVLTMVLLCLPIAKARANIMLEPYAGGQLGGELALKSFTTPGTGAFNSLVYGGRLGFDIKGYFIGAEYMASNNVTAKFGTPNIWGTTDVNATMTNKDLGAFAGIEFMSPFMIRMYGTFFATSDAHVQATDVTKNSDLELKGYGYKFEIDSRLHKYLSLGVSYYLQVYTKWIDNTTTAASPAVPVNTQQSFLLTLSIPIEM